MPLKQTAMAETIPLDKGGKPIPKAYRMWGVGVTDPHITGTLRHLRRHQYDFRIGQYVSWFGVFQTMLWFRRKRDADWIARYADSAESMFGEEGNHAT